MTSEQDLILINRIKTAFATEMSSAERDQFSAIYNLVINRGYYLTEKNLTKLEIIINNITQRQQHRQEQIAKIRQDRKKKKVNPAYLIQALKLCKNALKNPLLTKDQKRIFGRFIYNVKCGKEITNKYLKLVLHTSKEVKY